jgi:hypothetical protein
VGGVSNGLDLATVPAIFVRMALKRESRTGRFIEAPNQGVQGRGWTKVTIQKPQKGPTSVSLAEIRRAVRAQASGRKSK